MQPSPFVEISLRRIGGHREIERPPCRLIHESPIRTNYAEITSAMCGKSGKRVDKINKPNPDGKRPGITP